MGYKTKIGQPWLYDERTGSIVGVKDADGGEQLLFNRPNVTKSPSGIEIMPTNNLSAWNTDMTAGLTVMVDTTVLFDGRPTLKITIPAGASGTLKVGSSLANFLVPYAWDKKDFALAIKHEGFTGYNWSSTFPQVPTPYLGDASYTNFFTVAGGSLGSYPETKPRQGEWFVYKPAASQIVTGGGTPTVAEQMRCKLQWTQASQATECYIWVGFFGVMPKRKKATLIWCMDDGYACPGIRS